jgi:2-phospho-L-lactate guanylyltransferase
VVGLRTAGVLILKGMGRSKERLSVVLSRAQRRKLVRAMYLDVLDAVTCSRIFDQIAVVSADGRALSLASDYGVTPVREEEARGMNPAFELGMASLGRESLDIVALIPCDVPLLKAEDVAFLLGRVREGPKVVLVPSMTSAGTSILLMNPPDVIGLHFEEDSYRLHYEEAMRAPADIDVYWLEAGLDVDRPQDLLEVARSTRSCRTRDLLRSWRIEEMIGRSKRLVP